MKLRYNDGYYLQKIDIGFIKSSSVTVPYCFEAECNRLFSGLQAFSICDIHDGLTFVGPFVDPECMLWIDGLDYIIDYDSCMSIKTIGKQIKSQRRECELCEDSIHTLRVYSLNEERISALKRHIKKVQHKLAMLEVLRDYYEGRIDFNFPDGYASNTPHIEKPSLSNRIIDRLFGHYRIP